MKFDGHGMFADLVFVAWSLVLGREHARWTSCLDFVCIGNFDQGRKFHS